MLVPLSLKIKNYCRIGTLTTGLDPDIIVTRYKLCRLIVIAISITANSHDTSNHIDGAGIQSMSLVAWDGHDAEQ